VTLEIKGMFKQMVYLVIFVTIAKVHVSKMIHILIG